MSHCLQLKAVKLHNIHTLPQVWKLTRILLSQSRKKRSVRHARSPHCSSMSLVFVQKLDPITAFMSWYYQQRPILILKHIQLFRLPRCSIQGHVLIVEIFTNLLVNKNCKFSSLGGTIKPSLIQCYVQLFPSPPLCKK